MNAPLWVFMRFFCPSHKVISGYVEFQGETLFIVKDPWPVDHGQYWFMTYEQIVSEFVDNQSFGNIRKAYGIPVLWFRLLMPTKRSRSASIDF